MIEKPTGIFHRDREWSELVEFVGSSQVGNQLAVVLGRRRQGKSLLLQNLAAAAGGFYWEAAQQSRAQNLLSFARAWAQWRALPVPRLDGWESALDLVLGEDIGSSLLIFDEVGYLIETAPEFPSLLQRHLGPTPTPGRNARVVLCGSVFAQMTKLLAAGAPLRGRQRHNLRIDPFDYRTAAAFWGLDGNLDAAFRMHSLVGGTPAYRRFAGDEAPRRGDVGAWAVRHLLSPSSPLYREGELLVAEDSTLVDKAIYWSVLNAVADGYRRRQDLATAVGRSANALGEPLKVLAAGGWIELRPDPLHRNASTVLLTEPILRTQRILLAPERARLDRGMAQEVWEDAQPRLARLAYGPQLEWLAAEWCYRYAAPESLGGSPRLVAPAVLRSGGDTFQLDLVITEAGSNERDRICAIGEVKAGTEPVGVGELERLDELQPRLRDRALPTTKRLLVARAGFTAELRRLTRRRTDVELVDLERLYAGS